MSSIDYKTAGVDVEAGNEAVRKIKMPLKAPFHQGY
jgi:phosphoribosylaminoimidazole (AIR) synthetase